MLDGDHIVHKPSPQICRGTHIDNGNAQTNAAFTQILAWYPFKHAYITKSNARQFTDSLYGHVYANQHSFFFLRASMLKNVLYLGMHARLISRGFKSVSIEHNFFLNLPEINIPVKTLALKD